MLCSVSANADNTHSQIWGESPLETSYGDLPFITNPFDIDEMEMLDDIFDD